MKKLLLFILLLFPLFIFSQTTTLICTQNLSFGNLLPYSGGGTVTITPTNSRYATGNVIILSSSYAAATFHASGKKNRLVTISYTHNITLTRTGGGGSMNVTIGPSNKTNNQFTANNPNVGNDFTIGAVLTIGNAPGGIYTGSFNVTVIYN